MNRYKMKPGTTISDIEEYAKEKGLIFNTGGTWIELTTHFGLTIPVEGDHEGTIIFPHN